MRPDEDDLSDYISNYCDNAGLIEDNFLKENKIDTNDFLNSFNPTLPQIRAAIRNSSLLSTLAQKYIKAVVKTVSIDIYDNIIETDKDIIDDELQDKKKNENTDAVLAKIKPLNLTLDEKCALKRYLDNEI